jgi:hypothetical protein
MVQFPFGRRHIRDLEVPAQQLEAYSAICYSVEAKIKRTAFIENYG